jgi:endonuclease G
MSTNNSTSLKINAILILIGFVILICLPAPQTNDSHESNKNSSENPVTYEKIEIPAKITGRQELIIEHMGYTVSYNTEWKIPNWVAYELTREEAQGTIPRHNSFTPDPEIPHEKSATVHDYQYSGWDRGHMAPAGDMKWSKQAMKESFYLSNICPQNKDLNSGVWNESETQIRELAAQKGRIYIVCGPIVSKQSETIGLNKVTIPDAFFKVLLQNDNGNWSAIAFMFANRSGRKPLSTYAMSVEDMQIITDIDFFPGLPDSIEKNIESQADFTNWISNTTK